MTWFYDGGVMMYPLLMCAALVLVLAAWSGARLWGAGAATGPRTSAVVDAVLFWGVFAFVLGVLGTLVGVTVAAQAIERAGEVHASLAWGGVRIALTTTIFGVLILSVAALLWFGLRLRARTLEAAVG